jgi:hypothetical protein
MKTLNLSSNSDNALDLILMGFMGEMSSHLPNILYGAVLAVLELTSECLYTQHRRTMLRDEPHEARPPRLLQSLGTRCRGRTSARRSRHEHPPPRRPYYQPCTTRQARGYSLPVSGHMRSTAAQSPMKNDEESVVVP